MEFIFIVLIGIFLVFSSIKNFIKISKSNHYEGRTTGKVAEIKKTSSVSKGRRRFYYCAIYEYTANGQEYKEKFSPMTPNQNRYHIGDTTLILYDTSNPKCFIPEDGNQKLLKEALFCLIIGIVFIGFGIYSFYTNSNLK